MAKHRKRKEQESEERRARRGKRRRRVLIRAAVAAVAVALVLVVAFNWNTLSPVNLIGRIGSLFSGGGGSFPYDVSGSPIYAMDAADNCTVLLSDTYVTMINTSGGEAMHRAHSFTDPLLRTNGKYVLLAEKDGKRFRLETRSKTVLNKTLEYEIVTAAVHSNGNIAVVTTAEQGYNARLSVYATDGSLIYQRLCGTLIADVAFSPNGKDVAVATVGAEKGAMRSGIEVFSLHSQDSEPLCTYKRKDVLLLRIAYLSDSVIAAVGDNEVWMYHPWNDNVCNTYAFTDGELKAFAVGSSSVAIVTQPYGAATGGTLAYIGTDGNANAVCAIEGVCRDIAASGDAYVVLTDKYIYSYGFGGIGEPQSITSDSSRVVRLGQYAMVLGLQDLVQYVI